MQYNNDYEMTAAFLICQPQFPEFDEGTIDTIEFLNASRGLVRIVDQFGFGFEPVKNDLSGNIEKLLKKYQENTDSCKCLKQMILHENRNGEKYATESLLWLRRGLSFMEKFLSLFLENEMNGLHNENLGHVLCKAYEKSLKSHHGWTTRILFNGLTFRCPNRTRFLEILGYTQFNDRHVFISTLNDYLSKLQTNLEGLKSFCELHDIKPHH